jgi:hypothetical protein
MFHKIFLKEWRDNIVLFSIAMLFMLALVALNLSARKELTLYFMGVFLLLFLPVCGLLVGSGGFYSEFRDNAWIYMFSRPIKKEKIWLFKYVSLFSLLGAIILIFFFVKKLLPGLNEVMREFQVPKELAGLVSFSTYLALPVLVFTISFSLSILYEKQFAVLLISALAGAALAFVLQQFHIFLWTTYLYDGELKGFQVVLGLSFVAASILTLQRTDFSQTAKKVFAFAKYLTFFLVLSFVLATVWIAGGNPFSGKKWIETNGAVQYGGDVYFWTQPRWSLLRYSSTGGDVERVVKEREPIEYEFSVGGGKIAFFVDVKKGRRWSKDLWVMNTDGTGRRALAEAHDPRSPFHDLSFWGNCLLSPDGGKVAFVSISGDIRSKGVRRDSSVLWWMNTDGAGSSSRLRSDFPVDDLIAWAEPRNSLIVGTGEKASNHKVIRLDLETGTPQTLAENVSGWFRLRTSPRQDFLALCCRDPLGGGTILVTFDLRTLEKKVVDAADSGYYGALVWDPSGDRLAFSKKGEVVIYSAKEDRIVRSLPWSYQYGSLYGWLLDGEEFVLMEGRSLKVFDKEFKEEKRLTIPKSVKIPQNLWGLDHKVLVYDAEWSKLWRLDLITERWERVY